MKLCAVSQFTLVYEHISPTIYEKRRQLAWLDCSGPKPKPLGIISDENVGYVHDMCLVENENEKLLIIDTITLIKAYNTTTGQLKWTAEKKVPSTYRTFGSNGLTGDGNGHLFVWESHNKCIQMFSTLNGQYLGSLMRGVKLGLGSVFCLQYHESSKSLLVANYKNDRFFIDAIE